MQSRLHRFRHRIRAPVPALHCPDAKHLYHSTAMVACFPAINLQVIEFQVFGIIGTVRA